MRQLLPFGWMYLFLAVLVICPMTVWADAPLELVGQWVGGNSYAVAVSGNRAYVGMGPSLLVLDITQPSSPTALGQAKLQNTIRGLAVSGNYAYVADDSAGLQVIDISNPAGPNHVGGYDTSGSAYGVVVSGNYAYVADSYSGLQVIDISNPASPVRVGGYDTNGSARGVAVSGNYAYVADDYSGLQVIDISNPASPVRVGGYDTSGSAYGVAVSGNYAYVADSYSGLQVIDISSPSSPVLVGGYDTSGSACGVAVSGNYAYVADIDSGLQVINISNPALPVRVGGYNTSGSAYGVAVSGNYAYIADYSSGLQVIDVSNPATPARVGGCGVGTRYAEDIAISGNYAYVADRSYGLQVMNISNPASPLPAGGYDTSGYAFGVAVSGNYAYVADYDSGMQVIDISNPASPVRVGGCGSGYGSARDIAVSGNYAYIASYYSLLVINISNPASPVIVGSYYTSGYAYGVAVSGNYAYLAAISAGLQVIDISNPASPVRVGFYDTGGYSYDVAVSGSYAYVADYYGIEVIDISNPASPVRVGGYDTIGQAYDVAVTGSYAYVADGASGLQVIDIAEPSSPIFVNGYNTASSAYGVTLAGEYAYAASGSGGLTILRTEYTGFHAARPVFTPDTNTFYSEQNVTITCSTPGAIIHYTTNGLEPTESDTVIESGSSVLVDHCLTLKARAWKDGIEPSAVKTADYNLLVFTPVFDPNGGIYDSNQNVIITCSTPGSVIHYTTNNIDPNESDPIIESGSSVLVNISQPTSLKARAFKTGYTASAVMQGLFRKHVTVTIYVSTSGNDGDSGLSWETAKRTVQGGIDAALEPGDTVIIAPGTYTGIGNRNIDVNGKAITVTGTNPEDPCIIAATIIDCQSNGRGFYFHSGEDTNSILSGLTIKNGYTNNGWEGGAGILCDGASPTITNCVIQNNGISSPDASGGGGISCQNQSSPIISNCIITGNYVSGVMSVGGGGISSRWSSHPVITNCQITNNSASGGVDPYIGHGASASGGGVYCEGSIEIYNSIITGNRATGGGLPLGMPNQNPITSGSGYGGGIYIAGYEGKSTIVNCLIALNQARGGYSEWCFIPPEPPPICGSSTGSSVGGGIVASDYEDPNNIIISNCTIVANYAASSEWSPGSGGGISGYANVVNCIVRLNTAYNPIYNQIQDANVTFSNVEGGFAGTGNIDVNAMFVEDPNPGMDGYWGTGDETIGDVHLQAGSPCIDAGDNNAVPEGITTDLDDNWRFRDDPNQADTGNGSPPIVDMGTFERQWCPGNDLNGDCWIDFADFALFAQNWFEADCIDPDWCGGLDFDKSGAIDWLDLRMLVNEWLK